MTWTEIGTIEALEGIVGVATGRSATKVRDRLAPIDREWLAATPFCVLATSNAAGQCDASPKGDPAGQLVHVLDEHAIAIAERPGNRRVDGYRNVLENPHVGLNFLVPGRGDTLRINGRARLVAEAPFFDAMAVSGRRPILALVVEVEEVFYHCAKAFLRSGLWQPETWTPDALPRRAVIAHQVEAAGASLAELDAHYGPAYAEGLY